MRRLRDRDLWLHPEITEAHVAADEGDWAGYTVAQGGPLVARKDLRVRLNYEITPDGNAYGDDVSRITGVYSPFTGPDSLVFTRTATYKIVPKVKRDGVLAVDVQGAQRPLGVLSITVPVAASAAQGSGLDGTQAGAGATPTPIDFEKMNGQERRDLQGRLSDGVPKRGRRQKAAEKTPTITPAIAAELDGFDSKLLGFLRSIGLEPAPWEFDALLSGAVVDFGSGHAFRIDGDRLLPVG